MTGPVIIDIVCCQRCGAEVVDLIDGAGERLTKRRQPLTGEYEADRYRRWQNSYLRDGEDLICRDCLQADPIYRWSR